MHITRETVDNTVYEGDKRHKIWLIFVKMAVKASP